MKPGCDKVYKSENGARHHQQAGCRDKRLRVPHLQSDRHARAVAPDAEEDLPGEPCSNR